MRMRRPLNSDNFEENNKKSDMVLVNRLGLIINKNERSSRGILTEIILMCKDRENNCSSRHKEKM